MQQTIPAFACPAKWALPGQMQLATRKAKERQQGLAETVSVKNLVRLSTDAADATELTAWLMKPRGALLDAGQGLSLELCLCHLYNVVGEWHDSYYICHWPVRANSPLAQQTLWPIVLIAHYATRTDYNSCLDQVIQVHWRWGGHCLKR